MFNSLKLLFVYLFSKIKKNDKNELINNINVTTPRFFSLNDFDFYRIERMSIEEKFKNKKASSLFKKFLNNLLKKKFKSFFFFKSAKIQFFFIICSFFFFIFYYFVLDKNYEMSFPLSYYFYSQKPEDLILYLQNFEEIKRNQNLHFFSSEKITNSPFFYKFFIFDNIFFSPENIKSNFEYERSDYFKQFFENSLEKPLYKYQMKEDLKKVKNIDFSEENTRVDLLVEKSNASLKQKEYVGNLISKKNFLIFNHPKYKENFIKISRFQNFVADLGLLDIKISDFNQTFIEKQFPFKATHYKKSHIQALAELGINSKEDLYIINNDNDLHYQTSHYEIGCELNITPAANKFFLMQDQLNFFFFKNVDFRLFLLNKTNVNLHFDSFDFILNKYEIDAIVEKTHFSEEKDLLNLLTNYYSDRKNKFFRFYNAPKYKYNKNNLKEFNFNLIKPNSNNFFNKIFTNYKNIYINKNNFNEMYLFWFNYFDFTFLKHFKKRDFIYMLESNETGFFSFPENKDQVDENFFLNKKKSFKKLKKMDPFQGNKNAIPLEQYEEFLTLFLDFQIIQDNPEHNKYQEGCFDFIEGFTDKFLISNSFITLTKDINMKYQFSNLSKYNEIYNKIFYFFDIKINRIERQILNNRKNILNHIIKIIISNYKDECKSNILLQKDMSVLENSFKTLLHHVYLKQDLTKKLKILKDSNLNTCLIENILVNSYMKKAIRDYKFINNSFIYNIEKKNFCADILKKKLYFFDIYNQFLDKNFDYFFTKKINSNFSYLHLNTFNKDFLAYFKNITYYFKEHRFLFFYDFKNKNFIKNYKLYEEILKSNYGKNKDFDSYLFMLSNYNILNSNFNLFFINNLKNVFKQQICWNNLQNKNLNLNNEEINIIMNNFKGLFYYFKLHKYNLENILISKYLLINNEILPPIDSAFLIFNKLEQHLKENIQNQFLLKNYYNSHRFFITTFDRLNFFLQYSYYHGTTFKKHGFLDLDFGSEVTPNYKGQSNFIFTYTENVLDKSLLLRTQNRFLSLEYYSIIDKIAKIESSLDLINIEKKEIPAALGIATNDVNIHFTDLRPVTVKYPFPFVSEHLLLEREFTFAKNTFLEKKKRFAYMKKLVENIYKVLSEDFLFKYLNVEFWKYQINSFFFFFGLENFIYEGSDNENTVEVKDDFPMESFFSNTFNLLNLNFIYKISKIFLYLYNIKIPLFFYLNEYFFEYQLENYIELEEEEEENFIFTDSQRFQKWLSYLFFFLFEISLLNYLFSFSEYDLLENQRLICSDLSTEKKIGSNLVNLNMTSEYSFINFKIMDTLFKNLNYFHYNDLAKSHNIFEYIEFLKDDYYYEDEEPINKEGDAEDEEDETEEENNETINLFPFMEDEELTAEEANVAFEEEKDEYLSQLNPLKLNKIQELLDLEDVLSRESKENIKSEEYLWLIKSILFIYDNENLMDHSVFFESEIKNFMIQISHK